MILLDCPAVPYVYRHLALQRNANLQYYLSLYIPKEVVITSSGIIIIISREEGGG